MESKGSGLVISYLCMKGSWFLLLLSSLGLLRVIEASVAAVSPVVSPPADARMPLLEPVTLVDEPALLYEWRDSTLR